ncbi:spore maturation protein CgeB [Silvimonas terrae]|uniref:Spore maturation protein CgeB n=1 Tax=Silvimonas terrae TaxID=300266 RepID=A0A840RGW4_9NEIS|nr:3'-5' exoribonuclease [Silvimonas terrae]MBB5192297.1 spore maturation protein CgeB [Silvimonas terrae]
MLLLMDTEFTDFVDRELISIALVSEDGHKELYLEVQDFDRAKCNGFVQSVVWAQLGRDHSAVVRKNDLREQISTWFAELPAEITVACDSQHDRDLLRQVLGGTYPANLTAWFDLRPLLETEVFERAVNEYHEAGHPQHHALHDARASRAGWLAWVKANNAGEDAS